DRLVLKHHMITYYVRHGTCYRHRGLRSSTGPRTHRASSSYIQGMSLEARPESTGERPGSPLSPAHVVPIYLVGLRRSLVSICARVTLRAELAMAIQIVLMVLGAAIVHATWNALLKADGDRLALIRVMSETQICVSICLIPFVSIPTSACWPLLLASSALNTG